MPSIEVIENKTPDVENKPKPKRKRLTAEEKAAADKRKYNEIAARAAQRSKNAQARRNAKKATTKATRNAERATLRNRLAASVMDLAQQRGVSLTSENVKIPKVGIKENKLEDYYLAAKKRYYTRTKKPTSIRLQAMEQADQEGIPREYVKQTARTKTVGEILNAARKRYGKITEKQKKTGTRAAIMSMIMSQYPDLTTEEAVMKVVCVRKKADKK